MGVRKHKLDTYEKKVRKSRREKGGSGSLIRSRRSFSNSILNTDLILDLQRTHGNRVVSRILEKKRSEWTDDQVQREATHWYTPWLRDYEFLKGGSFGYANVDTATRKGVDSGWTRDALGTGVLSAVVAIAAAVIAKRLKLPTLLALIFGGAAAGARGYKGYTMQERIWGETIEIYNWYGKYRVNVITGNLKAVRFDGISARKTRIVAPWHYQQRIVDAKGNVIYTHWQHNLTYTGVDLSSQENLPEKSFGVFD